MEGQQVVLAERVERDSARYDELVVALGVGERRRLEGQRRQELRVGRGHAARGVLEALVGEVDAECFEQIGDGGLHAHVVHLRWVERGAGGSPDPGVCVNGHEQRLTVGRFGACVRGRSSR